MNCADVNAQIELFVLGGVTAAQHEAIEAHLATCKSCRRAEANCRLVLGQIRRGIRPDLPRLEFARKVRSAVKEEIRSLPPRRRVGRLVLGVASVAAVVLLSLVAWHLSGDARSVGHSSLARKDPSSPAKAPFSQVWAYKSGPSTPRSVSDEVVVQGHTIYVLLDADMAGRVAAFDTATGRQQWVSDVGRCGYVAADRLRVYCLALTAPGRCDLLALDHASGKVVWRRSGGIVPRLSRPQRPTVLPGNRVCWVTYKTVHMLRSPEGQVLWSRPIPEGGVLSGVVAIGGDLYVASGKTLYCLDAATGEPRARLTFSQEAPGRYGPLLVAGDGRFYVARRLRFGGARLTCVDPERRKVAWSRYACWATCLLVAPEGLYLRAQQKIEALDKDTGETFWTLPAAGCGPITSANGTVYFVDSRNRGQLVAVDSRTGRAKWHVAGIQSCHALVKVGNTCYLKTRDGVVHALALANRS